MTSDKAPKTTFDDVARLYTYSMYRMLDADVRENLLDAVRHLIYAFGGTVERPCRAVLFIARARERTADKKAGS